MEILPLYFQQHYKRTKKKKKKSATDFFYLQLFYAYSNQIAHLYHFLYKKQRELLTSFEESGTFCKLSA